MNKENYIIEKHITKRYEVTDIARFLKYDTFVDARKGMKNTPKTCFKCSHKFEIDEWTYLGIIKGDKNRIFCKKCAEEIVKDLGVDEKRLWQ